MEDNYYTILDVPETASMDEIKRAYRKLSLKYHPDKNIGNPETVNTFHKINAAFEVLGDADKKKQYDFTKKNPFFSQGMGSGNGVHIINMDDLLSEILFGGIRRPSQNNDPFDSFTIDEMNGIPHSHMFSSSRHHPFGEMHRPLRRASPMTKPSVITIILEIQMESILEGGVMPIEIERTIIENNHKRNEKVTVYVNVPQGIDDNEIILLQNEGHVHNQIKGDVNVFVKIINHTEFIRKGLDLIYERNISLKEALCGFSFPLKYINGKNYTIHNQRGNIVPNDFIKTISKMGITREGHKGNLIIHFKITFPTSLTEEQMKSLSTIL